MSTHISDELPRLLTGDATHDVVMAAAEHLRTCPDCQQELVSAVVAHASLMSAHRFAPEVVAPLPDSGGPTEPVTRLHPTDDAADPGESDGDALPDMSTVFDRIRTEARHAAPPRAGRGRRGLLAVAAAAVVLAGGGTAIGYAVEGGGTGGGGRTVALDAFGVGNTDARATISGDTVTLDAATLPKLGSAQRYEVWLTNSARSKMYSIGFLGDSSSATFTVQRSQLDRFTDIEVSRQPADELPYSGTSVLRGSYTA